MGGMSSQLAGGEGHGAGRGSFQGRGMVGDGLKMMPSNKRMHATADTQALKFLQRCGAARDARR